MDSTPPPALSPELLAAVDAGDGVARITDPVTQREFLVLEQSKPREPDEATLRAMLQEGIDELDRGEGVPWDPEALKEEIRERFRKRGIV